MKHRAPTARPSWGARIGDSILTLLAIAGSLCMIVVILSYFFNISIMMFRTGSMSPTIEAGSIALVREVPATGLQEGDVVTVDRGPSLLPVTHRVLDIQSIDEQTGVATFTMKGDANETPDPMPYSVDTVREVIFSIPGIAPAIQWFSNPLVLGGLTISASCLVVWAFWPKDPKPRNESPEVPTTFAVLPLLFALVPLGLPSAENYEEPRVEEVRGEVLQIRSITYPQTMENMSPGDSASWIVDVWAEAPEPGVVAVHLTPNDIMGQNPSFMRINIQSCQPSASIYAPPACGRNDSTYLFDGDLEQLQAETTPVFIDEFATSERHRFHVTGTLADHAPAGAQGVSATLQLTATGHGETLRLNPKEDDPREILPETGIHGLPWIVLVVAVLISVGVVAHEPMRRHRNA